MACLHPITLHIKRASSIRPLDFAGVNKVKYKDVRPFINEDIQVPCGKCIACLRARQNAFASRCIEESNKRGSFCFVTLTYREDCLPVAQSLYRVSKDSGEMVRLSDNELIKDLKLTRPLNKLLSDVPKDKRIDERYSFRRSIDVDRRRVTCQKSSFTPRYYDVYIPEFGDDEFDYLVRYTPSVDSRDVRLWLKRARVRYERDHGFKLPDFSYACVSEYGARYCRPHYHLAFFGLNRLEVQWLCDQWPYGYTQVKYVNRVNPDGTDGFQIASRYIGKYMSKGKFDTSSVVDGDARKCRVCQSKGLGKGLIEKLRSYLCCFDLFGRYDLDTFFVPSLGRCLTQSELAKVVSEVPKRFTYQVSPDFRMPVPKFVINAVFKKTETHKLSAYGTDEKNFGKVVSKYETTSKPFVLWSLVASAVAQFYKDKADRILRRCSSFGPDGEMQFDFSSFAYYQEVGLALSESARESNYISFLARSKDCQ